MSTLALFSREQSANVDSSDAQCTPRDLALDLGIFGIDVCTNPRSHIQSIRTFSLENGQDGLAEEWTLIPGGPLASVWCNGEYSNPLPWCERLRAHDAPWCSLWKLETTTEWHRQLMAPGPRGYGGQWAPFRMRLKFERPGNCGGADFCSMLVWRDFEVPDAVRARLWMRGDA